MRQNKSAPTADDLVSIKEAAHILRISPKTIYNRLGKGQFPLKPFRLPWNRRDLFFHRDEVIAMSQIRAAPTKSCLRKLLKFIPEPAEPIPIAVFGSHAPLPASPRNRFLIFKCINTSELASWPEQFDLLWLNRQRPALFLAQATTEHFEAAAFICGVCAEILRGDG